MKNSAHALHSTSTALSDPESVGVRESMPKPLGGSSRWNQQTTTAFPTVQNHKILFKFKVHVLQKENKVAKHTAPNHLDASTPSLPRSSTPSR